MTHNGSAAGRSKPREELKIVIVGDGGCGKTSLLMVYAKGDFPEVSRCVLDRWFIPFPCLEKVPQHLV